MVFQNAVRHKFNAKRCELDGKKFSSKLERDFYAKILMQQKSGDVIFCLRQIPFDLPGGVRHFVDFQIFFSDGTVEFVDTKGVDTPMGKAKRKMVEDIYPIKIRIATR